MPLNKVNTLAQLQRWLKEEGTEITVGKVWAGTEHKLLADVTGIVRMLVEERKDTWCHALRDAEIDDAHDHALTIEQCRVYHLQSAMLVSGRSRA